MTLAAGTRLGPYEILSPLGAGGMGEVYKARDTKLDRDVAIKVLPASLARDPAALARFEREAKAVAALSHPNILAVHDFGTSGETTYAVMELLDGESLRQRLAEGALPTRKAAEIAREIALGLAAAHDKGIVHRDLKPENLFLTKEGRVKILDFGLARQLGLPQTGDTHSPTAAPGTEPGTVLGTVGYMAPEQLRGQPSDHRSDIFSFGAVLYEMLAGRRAFLGETAIETMNAILKEDPPEISSGKTIPPGFERIVSHCLEKKPDERFQSARDLAFDLGAQSTASAASGAVPAMAAPSRTRRRLVFSVVGLAGLAIAFWAGTRLGSGSVAPRIRMQRLTFRRGNVMSARFAPDGQTVVYGAAWEGKPSELFSVRTDSVESRPLGLEHANVLSVSPRGELAVLLNKGSFQIPSSPGTLARVPLGGGAARELQEGVISAAWAPDGENLAVIRLAPSGKLLLEYPVGHAISESFYLSNRIVISPARGDLAWVEEGAIWVADRSGRKRKLVEGLREVQGIAWSRTTGEILYFASRGPGDSALRAATLAGRERILWSGTANLALHDVAPDGRLLVERASSRTGVLFAPAFGAPERELGWLDGTSLADLSRDGSRILFTETGESVGATRGVYLRGTDGSPAVRLGDGNPTSLSPDGRWAMALTTVPKPEIVLLPTGPGSPRKVPVEGVTPLWARFLGDGRRILIYHSAPGEPPRGSVVGIEGGRPTAIPITGINADVGTAYSPDGARMAYGTSNRRILVAPLAGGDPTPVPGAPLGPCESIYAWTGNGRSLIVANYCEVPATVFRVDLLSGERTLLKELVPGDRAGVISINNPCFQADGDGYAYSYVRVVSSDLYLIDGLK